ncbi:MAG: hypothetical protein ACLFTI_05445 [Anaerolineales bacterium]
MVAYVPPVPTVLSAARALRTVHSSAPNSATTNNPANTTLPSNAQRFLRFILRLLLDLSSSILTVE